jgi:NDP-sugar pyrophosphorylase family protein
MRPSLLVLAAGMGNRYGGLKQIDPIGPAGETFIDYSIFDALRAGFGKVVFVIRRDIEAAFRDAVGRRFEPRVEVRYVFQELDGRAKPWGTGHAILSAASAIEEPFAVINGDDFYGAASFRLMAGHLGSSPDYAMVAFTLRNTLSEHGSVSRGVCDVGPDGLLRGVVEHVEIVRADLERRFTGEEPVSMNMWGFSPRLFGQLAPRFTAFRRERGADPKAEFFIPTVVGELVSKGEAKVRVLRTPEPCFGVTYKEDRPAVSAAVARLAEAGVYPARLWT